MSVMRILIVEDEPQILRDLVRMVARLDPEYEVHSARNAIEAQTLLLDSAFDILMTDINMPVMSGLELIAWVRERDMPVQPVIVSGYSDFHYARQSIRLGVNDYVLKPVDVEEVARMIGGLAQRIRETQRDRKRQVLQKMVAGETSPAEGERFEAAFGNSTGASGNLTHVLAVFCIGTLTESPHTDEVIRNRIWEQMDLENRVTGLLMPGEGHWVFRSSGGTQTLLLDIPYGGPSSEMRSNTLCASFMGLFDTLPMTHVSASRESIPSSRTGLPSGSAAVLPVCGLTIAVSPSFRNASEVSVWHRKLLRLLRKTIIPERSRVVQCQEQSDFQIGEGESRLGHNVLERLPAPSANPLQAGFEACTVVLASGTDLQTEYETFGTMIRYKSPHMARELQQIVHAWMMRGYTQIQLEHELDLLAESVSVALAGDRPQEMRLDTARSLRGTLDGALNGDMLFESIRSLIEETMQSQSRPGQEGRHDQLVHSMTQYIGQHLSEPLNNSLLAARFCLAPSYISALFRQREGVSPIEYIAQLRMKRACLLMTQSPQMQTKDVAERVGYKDPLHFSKSFKKIIGRSPAQFREDVQRGTT